MRIDLSETTYLIYKSNYLAPAVADDLLKKTVQDTPWEQSLITLFGKRIPIPRLNAWFGQHSYTYSGTTFPAKSLTPILESLKERIEKQYHIELNCVLANLYRDGSDGMGWHSDNEKSLGAKPQIASVSLGEKRRFLIRAKADTKNKKELVLEHGSLLIMRGDCQTDWEHSVPKTAKPKGQRVNLTFRYSIG